MELSNNNERINFSDDLFNYSAVAIFAINPEHYVIYWNKACEELTGFAASDIIGTSNHWSAFYEHIRPCLSDIVISGQYELISKFYSTYGKSTLITDGLHAEGWYKNLGNKKRYIMFDAAPIYNTKGELIAAIETLQDVTDDKLISEERERQISELQMALTNSKSLKGYIHICAWCKKMRNDKGIWDPIEIYFEKYFDAKCSHGICPECLKKVSLETYLKLTDDEN